MSRSLHVMNTRQTIYKYNSNTFDGGKGVEPFVFVLMQFCRWYLLNSCYCINGKLRMKLAKSNFSTFQHKIWCCLHWLLRFASWFYFFCLKTWKKCVVHPPIFKSLNLDFYSTKFIEVKIICEHIFRRLWWKGRGKCNSVFCWLDTKIYMEKKNLDSYRPSVFFILYI